MILSIIIIVIYNFIIIQHVQFKAWLGENQF